MSLALGPIVRVSSTIRSIVSAGSTVCAHDPCEPHPAAPPIGDKPSAPIRHRPGDTDTARAIAVFASPSAPATTAFARTTSLCAPDCDPRQRLKNARCDSESPKQAPESSYQTLPPKRYLFARHTTSLVECWEATKFIRQFRSQTFSGHATSTHKLVVNRPRGLFCWNQARTRRFLTSAFRSTGRAACAEVLLGLPTVQARPEWDRFDRCGPDPRQRTLWA